MGWLEQKTGQIFHKMRNLSLRKTLGIYMMFAIFLVTLATVATNLFCTGWIELVMEKYDLRQYSYGINGLISYIQQPRNSQEKANNIICTLQIIKSASVLLYSLIAILITSHIFYKNKLQEPLRILQNEADCVAREDLSFVCAYESNDEMGEVCSNFDQMRLQLVKNKKNLWNLMEEQRQLNAAFAHDLRTPLTVMSGYIEMLDSCYPDGNVPARELQHTMKLMDKQVRRLQDFSETMRTIHTFEQMQVNKSTVSAKQLSEKIMESIKGLNSAVKQRIQFKELNDSTQLYIDMTLFMEVFDNLMSNAIRYAGKLIEIELQMENRKLYLYVRDDGTGFAENEMEKAARPYYTGETKQDHYGLGLTICKMLCEKHGGDLSLSNSFRGGAVVGAEFYVE